LPIKAILSSRFSSNLGSGAQPYETKTKKVKRIRRGAL